MPLAVLLLTLLVALALGGHGADPVDARAPGPAKPNIILVVTDDQPASAFTPGVMPRTSRRVARRGTTFTEAVATTPLCCPARATMLTGQYGHNTGILENDPGWPALADRANTLPNWLRAAGYRTAHVGKWLHGYGERTEGKNAVAPGWSQWHTLLAVPTEYYDFKLRVNGRRAVRYGDEPRDYLTRVLNRKATRLIKRQLPRRKPLYLQLDHLAPHSGSGGSKKCRRGAVPDPRDRKRFRKARLPKPPNFNEANVDDKPSFASERALLDAADTKSITRRYRCALASLRAVDRGIGMITRAVRRAGERRDTAIILVSDNGYFRGEHRMLRGKGLAYEESIRVPMAVLLPPRLAGGQDRLVAEPVANLDLTPTILELAGATPCRGGECRTLDGRSLVGLARGSTAGWPDDRAVAIEFDKNGGSAPSYGDTCAYAGLRTPTRLFVDHTELPDPEQGYACEPSPGVEELYHLDADPFQLTNLAATDPGGSAAERATLLERLERLRTCAGIAGRDPAPPGGFNCE